DVRARLCAGLAEEPDLIIVSGGVSVGPYDHVRTAFAEVGEVDLWRGGGRAGEGGGFGGAGAGRGGGGPGRRAPRPAGRAAREPVVLLLGVRGNPVSTFVTFELFVRPAILALLGRRGGGRAKDRAVLLDDARTSTERRAYLRVAAERDANGGVLRDELGRVR